MGFRGVLFLIVTPTSLVTFGKLFGIAVEQSCYSCLPQTDGQTEVVNRTLSTVLHAVINKNLKSCESCLPHVECAYVPCILLRVVSPFGLVYGFNPLTTLDLLPLPNLSIEMHKDGKAKSEFVKRMHEHVKARIERKIEGYARQANKGRKRMIFAPGDWVWVHMRKERFPSQRKSLHLENTKPPPPKHIPKPIPSISHQNTIKIHPKQGSKHPNSTRHLAVLFWPKHT